MTIPQRLLLLAALLAGAQAVVRATERYFVTLPAMAPEQDLAQAIPLELPADVWRGTDVSVASEIRQTLAADVDVNREYQNPLGEMVAVNVAVFRDYSLSPPHPPLACYPADGWTLRETQSIPVNPMDAASPQVPLYFFERQGEQRLVMFWMDLGGQIVFDRDGIRRVLRGLPAQTHQPLLKKVMLYTRIDAPQRARLRLDSVAAAIFVAASNYH